MRLKRLSYDSPLILSFAFLSLAVLLLDGLTGGRASKEDVLQNWAIDRTFTPEITDEERNKKVRMWKKAVTYSFNWAKED